MSTCIHRTRNVTKIKVPHESRAGKLLPRPLNGNYYFTKDFLYLDVALCGYKSQLDGALSFGITKAACNLRCSATLYAHFFKILICGHLSALCIESLIYSNSTALEQLHSPLREPLPYLLWTVYIVTTHLLNRKKLSFTFLKCILVHSRHYLIKPQYINKNEEVQHVYC